MEEIPQLCLATRQPAGAASDSRNQPESHVKKNKRSLGFIFLCSLHISRTNQKKGSQEFSQSLCFGD